MSKFTKQFRTTYNFEGDVVNVTMTRLKRKDAIKLAPFMTEPDEDGKVTMALEDSMKFADAANVILVNCITEFEGLKDAGGNALSKEDVFGAESEAYFMSLTSEIISDLMDASFVGADDEKKSNEHHKDTSTELEEQTHS